MQTIKTHISVDDGDVELDQFLHDDVDDVDVLKIDLNEDYRVEF